MAYTYLRTDSPWVWICFLDAAGKRRRKPTDVRKNTAETNRRSRKLEAEYTAAELELPRVRRDADRWENWVPAYIERRYKDSPKSMVRAQNAWAALAAYFEQVGVKTARGLDYKTAAAFIDWRLSPTRSGLRSVKHNTAVLEAKFLAVIMGEAVRRELASTNPCREMEIARVPAKQKREITREEEVQIVAALDKEPAWARESWEVYMVQGCRLSEVEVPLDRINERAGLITFRLKGGRMHTTTLHPDLLPLVARAREEKRAVLVTLPASPARAWKHIFRRAGIPDLSLHCTRVTVITRLIERGADPLKVQEFIGHSSEEIQAIYRRLKPSFAAGLTSLLGSRPASGGAQNSPSN